MADQRAGAPRGVAPLPSDRRTAGTAAALLAPPLLGACVDAVTVSRPGWALALGAVAGSLWAAARATARGGLGWVVPMPPLVVAAVTVGTSLLTSASSPLRGEPLPTEAARWAVDCFPVMVAAECALLAVLTLRGIRSLRAGRSDDA